MRTPKAGRAGPIDWAEIRRRLDQANLALEESGRHTPEESRRLMDERARALARVLSGPLPSERGLEVLVFQLGGERYAVETRCVREVLRLTDLTPVPGVPGFVHGVVNHRSDVLAVIDLRRFFGIAAEGLSDLSRVIVLGGERAEFGVLADEVHEVRALRAEAILHPPESIAGAERRHLRGVTQEGLLVLDGEVLLEDDSLYVGVEGPGPVPGDRNLP